MATTVSIDRTSLTLDALVIDGDGAGTFTLTDKGLGRPAVTARTTSAGTSPWIHGELPISAVREQSALPLEVYIHADDEAALKTATAELDAALWQFTYEVTVTEGTSAVTWLCSPASYGIAEGIVSHFNVSGFFEVWTVTIPVYPIPVT